MTSRELQLCTTKIKINEKKNRENEKLINSEFIISLKLECPAKKKSKSFPSTPDLRRIHYNKNKVMKEEGNTDAKPKETLMILKFSKKEKR